MKYILFILAGAFVYTGIVLAGAKVTICHATESETNPWNRIVVSINAIGGHFENNGTPKAGHEDDLLFEGDVTCPVDDSEDDSDDDDDSDDSEDDDEEQDDSDDDSDDQDDQDEQDDGGSDSDSGDSSNSGKNGHTGGKRRYKTQVAGASIEVPQVITIPQGAPHTGFGGMGHIE